MTTTLTLTPAVLRGTTPGTALRAMLDLGGDDEAPERKRWLATATACVLGQLAATAPSTSQNILGAVCTVASAKKSVLGLEAVLLSALLGTDPGTAEEPRAAEAWARYGPDPGAGLDAGLVAVLNPHTRDLAFLNGGELVSATSSPLGLRAGLLAFLDHADDPDRQADAGHGPAERTFADAVALAGGAVGAAYADTTGAAGPTASAALPAKLAAGFALLVEVLPVDANAGIEFDDTDPDLPAPLIRPLGVAGLQHPYWAASFLCSSNVPQGSWLSTLAIARGRSFVLGAMPRVDDGSGRGGSRGYLPTAQLTGTGGRLTASTTPSAAQATPAQRSVPQYVSYAAVLNPLTGQPAYFAFYPPGYAPPHVQGIPDPIPGAPIHPPPVIARVLTDSVRTLEFATTQPIGDLVKTINSSTYGATLNAATRHVRGYRG